MRKIFEELLKVSSLTEVNLKDSSIACEADADKVISILLDKLDDDFKAKIKLQLRQLLFAPSTFKGNSNTNKGHRAERMFFKDSADAIKLINSVARCNSLHSDEPVIDGDIGLVVMGHFNSFVLLLMVYYATMLSMLSLKLSTVSRAYL